MIVRACVGVALAALLVSCSGEIAGPVSGSLEVRLNSPNTDDGAALFTVSGGPVETAEALVGTLYVAKITGNTTRVVVAGTLTSGPIALVRIADMSHAGLYSVELNQVAARSTYARREPSGYTISLTPKAQ
jgi:hypothetical protein